MIPHIWSDQLAACYHLTFDDELQQREGAFITSLKDQQASHDKDWRPSAKQRAWLLTIWERLFIPEDNNVNEKLGRETIGIDANG